MLQLKNILFKNISQNDPIKNFILRKMEEKLSWKEKYKYTRKKVGEEFVSHKNRPAK